MSTYSMTSDDLIASVKRRAFIPEHQNTFTEEDFLAFADEEMAVAIVPMILRMHEDYLMYTQQVPLQENTTRYTIPYRAIGNKLKEISFQDGNGNIFEMTRIDISDLPFYNNQPQNRPYAFYVENNEVCLVGKGFNAGDNKLLFTYFMRPNSLVMLDKVAVISAINRTTGEITVSNLPTTFKVGSLVDFIQKKSPNKTLGFDISATSINTTGKIITIAPSDIPEKLSVGDHVAHATQSAIPQIPSDMHVMLPMRVAARCQEAMGDSEALALANQKISETDKQAEALIDNRVDEAPKKIVNRHSAIRGGLRSRTRWRI